MHNVVDIGKWNLIVGSDGLSMSIQFIIIENINAEIAWLLPLGEKGKCAYQLCDRPLRLKCNCLLSIKTFDLFSNTGRKICSSVDLEIIWWWSITSSFRTAAVRTKNCTEQFLNYLSLFLVQLKYLIEEISIFTTNFQLSLVIQIYSKFRNLKFTFLEVINTWDFIW